MGKTHFSGIAGQRVYGTTLPSAPSEGEEFIDSTNNIHYIYAGSRWWGAAMTTSTSTSTTSTSSSTSSSTTTSTSSSTTSTSSSTSTTTSI
jgi:hypothetical protein